MTTQIFILACTIALEAGNQPYAGKVMVAQVIVNQAHQRGKSLSDTCLIPKLFSCWNNRAPKRRIKKLIGSEAWKDCLAIAKEISQPGYAPVSPVTHYFNPSKASPSWAKRMRLVAIIGNHHFLCEKGTP